MREIPHPHGATCSSAVNHTLNKFFLIFRWNFLASVSACKLRGVTQWHCPTPHGLVYIQSSFAHCPGFQEYTSFFFGLFYKNSLADHSILSFIPFPSLFKTVFDLKPFLFRQHMLLCVSCYELQRWSFLIRTSFFTSELAAFQKVSQMAKNLSSTLAF